MSRSLLNSGRGLMLVSNLMYSVGAFAADWNETHIHNPTWPGHARFHNGQTMTIGVLLTLASTYFIFRGCESATAQRDSLWTAAVIGSLYCTAGLSAIQYPGATWNDPPAPSGRPQLFLFSALVVLNWIGYGLGVTGISKNQSVKRA